jgi:hypothetical protein
MRKALWIAVVVLVAAGGWLLWLLAPADDEGATGLARATAHELTDETPIERMADAAQELVDEDDCGRDTLYSIDGEITGNAAGKSPVEEPLAPFSLHFKDEVSPYTLMSTFVLPGEELAIEAVFAAERSELEATSEEGRLVREAPSRWRWTAPAEPGVHCIRVRDPEGGEETCLNAFVMVPYAGEEEINGYRIGKYQEVPLDGRPAYERPRGLVEVTRENLGTWVTPHFRLAQFVCKQESGYPKYVVLRERLLLELETVLEQLRQRGVEADTLYVMSGYRTPYYNLAIGNRTTYSRHTYGDAADVYVDRDGDGRMDDIDGDGEVDVGDARFLQGMIEELTTESWFAPFVGGLGLYPPNPAFGPMVHVDTRGFRARWSG